MGPGGGLLPFKFTRETYGLDRSRDGTAQVVALQQERHRRTFRILIARV